MKKYLNSFIVAVIIFLFFTAVAAAIIGTAVLLCKFPVLVLPSLVAIAFGVLWHDVHNTY